MYEVLILTFEVILFRTIQNDFLELADKHSEITFDENPITLNK